MRGTYEGIWTPCKSFAARGRPGVGVGRFAGMGLAGMEGQPRERWGDGGRDGAAGAQVAKHAGMEMAPVKERRGWSL